MEQKQEIILGILKKLFGAPKREAINRIQYEFNCPSNTCKNDINKYNLQFNSNKIIFHCFKCGYHGALHSLVGKYGSEEDFEKIKILYPQEKYKVFKKTYSEFEESKVVCKLPKDYRPLTEKYDSKYYYVAMKYLAKRKVTKEMIKKFEIGYTEAGERQFRIIIPSRNKNGDINYYEARNYLNNNAIPYFKPDFPDKLDIIFNEYNVNFDLPVYIVEGPFDMLPLTNAIVLLGKDLSRYLIAKFIKHKTKIILCLDEDAIEDTIRIYNELSSYGLNVYIVEVKDDIAKYYEKYGRKKLFELLGNYKKPNFTYFYSLSLNSKKPRKKRKNNPEQMHREMEEYKKQIKEENE